MTHFPLALLLAAAPAHAPARVAWQPWGEAPFAQAGREHKLVLLEMEAVWCHWCHVQDETTYRAPAVIAELGRHFIAVKVDQDAQPALSERYARWGWPAIVVLTPNGREIRIHRGYADPGEMLTFLHAATAHPVPSDAVDASPPASSTGVAALTEAQRADLLSRDIDTYDDHFGGWGEGHKLLDADELELALVLAERGDARQAYIARQTLDAARGLIDPTWGGVAQYSATPDWRTPHVERLLTVQGDAMLLYARAFALFGNEDDRGSAEGAARYVQTFLTAEDGALDVSQDADLSSAVDGPHYYALTEVERRRLGLPRVDAHHYARQTALGALGFLALSDATGDRAALDAARRAVAWVQAHRAVAGGGFRHGDDASAPLALADTLSMGRALLALYGSTAERPYLAAASQAASFIAANFEAGPGAGFASEPVGTAKILAAPYVSEEDNAALARWANLLFQYTGDPAHRTLAEKAMRYLARPDVVGPRGLRSEILLADRELTSDPLHVTVVGAKGDPAAQPLFREARRTPVSYLRTDWRDPAEPPLPHLEVAFPPLSKPAAFVCDQTTCSLPQTNPEQLRKTLHDRL